METTFARVTGTPHQLAVWSSGMILAQGVRGPGLNFQNSPCHCQRGLAAQQKHPTSLCARTPLLLHMATLGTEPSLATRTPGRWPLLLTKNTQHLCMPERPFSCTWTHWGLSPGPSACRADVIPLHHVPLSSEEIVSLIFTENTQHLQGDILSSSHKKHPASLEGGRLSTMEKCRSFRPKNL